MSLTKPEEKYTYAHYLNWPENERWEIIDGVPYMQAAPSRIHQEISIELATQLHTHLRGKTCRAFTAPFCVRLDAGKDDDVINVVEPDISIVCDSSKLDEKGCKGTPDMIVEILSPSTNRTDRFVKFNKYEKAGLKEYWIIDPEAKLVSVFTLQADQRYGRPAMYTEEDVIKVFILPDLEIDLKPIFNY